MHSLLVCSIILFILTIIPTYCTSIPKNVHFGLHVIKCSLAGWITGGILALVLQGII